MSKEKDKEDIVKPNASTSTSSFFVPSSKGPGNKSNKRRRQSIRKCLERIKGNHGEIMELLQTDTFRGYDLFSQIDPQIEKAKMINSEGASSKPTPPQVKEEATATIKKDGDVLSVFSPPRPSSPIPVLG